MSVELHDIESTEGDDEEHEVPADLLDIFVACDEAGVTPEEFQAGYGESPQ